MVDIALLYEALMRRGISARPRSERPNISGFLRFGENARYYAKESDNGDGWLFGDFVDGWNDSVFEKQAKPLNAAQIRQRKREAEKARKKAAEIQAQMWQSTAQKALKLWQQAQAADSHDYLSKKQIQAHGVKTAIYNGIKHIVIPASDASGKIWTLQYIAPDGCKRFLSGGKKKGCFFIIGEPDKQIIVCEGFATGASINEATNCAVAVAFDKGNLESVAKAMLLKYPACRVAIAADNDIKENAPDNVGLNEAARVAKIYNLTLFIPYLKNGCKCDFNDVAVFEGLDAVKMIFEHGGVELVDINKEV
jgi:putative DNA primase/helicase